MNVMSRRRTAVLASAFLVALSGSARADDDSILVPPPPSAAKNVQRAPVAASDDGDAPAKIGIPATTRGPRVGRFDNRPVSDFVATQAAEPPPQRVAPIIIEPTTSPTPLTTGDVLAPSTTGDVVCAESVMLGRTLAPNMLGDYIGNSPFLPGSGLFRTPQDAIAAQRAITRYKVADNNSPLPQTRLLYDFNYFNNAFAQGGDLLRHTGGFEKAFFNQSFSIDARFSVNSLTGFGSPDETLIGDLRTNFKALLVNRPGVIVSGGLGVGWPTGSKPYGSQPGNFYLSPFVGYLVARPGNAWFIQGFEQLDIPTDSRDQMQFHSDVGFGYWVRRDALDQMITAIAPTAELHLYTPTGSPPSGNREGLRYADVLNATLGATFYFGANTSLGVGLSVPISNQKDYDLEAQVHLNWRF